MRWSDPPTLRALDPHGPQWSQLPASFDRAARRILGENREAAEEAVTLSLTALLAAIQILADLLPSMGLADFGECVRALRADRELRARFRALYATKTASGRAEDFPGAPSMLSDPFCMESTPSRYWFDASTCEGLVCTFIARHTLNRRRSLLDVHESGVTYSLRGIYKSEEGEPPRVLDFLSSEDVKYVDVNGEAVLHYYIHPTYEYRGSTRKLSGAEVVLRTTPQTVLDIDLQTGDLFNCFEGYKLVPHSVKENKPPYLNEVSNRVQQVSDDELADAEAVTRAIDTQSGLFLVDRYTFVLIKRVTPDVNRQVAMNRALTQYFRPASRLRPLTGWSLRYDHAIQATIGDSAYRYSFEALMKAPEDKPSFAFDPQVTEGAHLNVLLAVWLQAQMHLSDLPTDVAVYLKANLPRSLREMSEKGGRGKPTWTEWAKRLTPQQGISPKLAVDAWAAAWKILEVVLQHHNDRERSRITYSEFVDAMPIKVYPNNYETELQALGAREGGLP